MKPASYPLITALFLGVIVALAPMSRAQQSGSTSEPTPTRQRDRQGGGQAGANAFDRLATQLKLTTDQKTKLQPIYREEMTKMRELRQDTTLTSEQRREKVRGLREEYLGKMKPVLTTEQFEQLKKMREANATRALRSGRSGGQERTGGAGGSIGEKQP